MTLLDFMNTETMNIVMKRKHKNNNKSISYIWNSFPVEIGQFNSEIYHKIFYEWSGIFYKVRRSPL